MGMFDEVTCYYQLPGLSNASEIEFQTKGFDNILDKYIITEEGELFLEDYDLVSVSEEERPYYGTDLWENNPITKLFGSFRRSNIRIKPKIYSGSLDIYYFDEDTKNLVNYILFFKEGRVIEVIKP